MINNQLHGDQIKIDASGNCFRRALVELKGDQSISWLRETPSAWRGIQSNINSRLQRGDIVDVISADGLQLSEQHRVVHALAGSVTLSKPIRIIELQEHGLYEDANFQVVPQGLAYAIRNRRSGHTEPRHYPTSEAARAEVLRRHPA